MASIFSNVGQADIDAVKRLSSSDRDQLEADIDACDPHSIFTPAGDNHDHDKRNIICPVCGNGTGHDATPIVVSQKNGVWLYNCLRCGDFKGDLLKIITESEHLNPKDNDDWCKVLAIGANLIGYPLFAENNERKSFKHAQTTQKFESEKQEKSVKDYSKKFYPHAQAQLKVFLKKCRDGVWRGFSNETLEYFGVGYEDSFGKAKTPTIIIPYNDFHFFARFVGDENTLSAEQKTNLRPKYHSAGDKPVFNVERALNNDDPICFVVESATDAMSIFHATNFNAIAVSGSSLTRFMREQLLPFTGKQFIVMLDGDATGQAKKKKLVEQLISLGNKATSAVLSDTHKDANDFLQADPEGFAARLKVIFNEAKNFFDTTPTAQTNTTENDLDTQIAKWQVDNGEIDANLLQRLKSEADRISAITDFAAAAKDTSTQRFLGACQYYSFFAHVYDKFFADLIRAKSAVASKIKDYEFTLRAKDTYVQSIGEAKTNEKLATLAPSDSELALTNLKVADIRQQVQSFYSKARKDHKKFLAQKNEEALCAKYNDEIKEYENNTPTTKAKIPDCPVDLILPLGVYFDAGHGIRIVDFDKPVGKNGRPVIEACQNIVVPIRRFREKVERGESPKTNDQYEIAIKTNDKWNTIIVDGRTILDARSVPALTNFGALITEPKFFAKYMAKIIALNEKCGRLDETAVYTQPGWHGDKFIYPTGGEDYIVKNGDFDYKRVFSAHGDSDAWLNMLKRVLFHDPKHYCKNTIYKRDDNGNITATITPADNPDNLSSKPNLVAAMVLGANFAAPLIYKLGIRNVQLHLGFDSGNGKTALGKFGVSFYGDPDTLVPKCNSTFNFLEDLAVKINDFPHAVDELQSARKIVRDNMDELVYGFECAITRGRADIQGNARPTYRYRGFRCFTGEQTILNDNSGNGAISRILEIKTPELFEDSFAIELHNFTKDHFALFGRQFITDYIPNHLNQIKDFFNDVRYSLTKDSDILSNHASIIAYSITGLYSALDSLGFDNAMDIALAVLDAAQDIIDDAPSKKLAKNINRALPELLNFFNSRPKNFEHEKVTDNGVEYTQAEACNDSYGVIGVTLDDGRIAINPHNLRKILTKELNFPNAKAIINGFGEAGYFDGNKSNKSKPYMKRLPNEYQKWAGQSTWFYILKPADQLESMLTA